MYLTQSQIEMYAAAAGAPNPQLAAAIAMAETDGTGNASSHNPIPPDDSYGLWQINMIGSEGPQRRAALGITSNSQLYDPATNARAMMLVSNGGTNFGPWTTYQDGKYEKYLSKTGAAVPISATTGQQANVGGDLLGGLEQIPGLINPGLGLWNLITGDGPNPLSGVSGGLSGIYKAGQWLSRATNWVRVGYVIGGGVLVVVGLAMVVKDQELKQVTGTVGKALGKPAAAAGTRAKTAATTKAKQQGRRVRERLAARRDQPGWGQDE